MRAFFRFLIVIFAAAASVYANASTEVTREAYFTRAFQSLAFLMEMAGGDARFQRSLTPQEAKMFQYIESVAADARNRQWFEANRIQNFPIDGWDAHYYSPAVGGARPRYSARAISPVHFGLTFSSESKLFQLKPGEPDRTAMTNVEMNFDIFVNRNIVNNAATKLTFPQAVNILIHEFGHKLPNPQIGMEKDQDAIDSLAGKIQSFLENQMSTVEVAGGKVHVLKFKFTDYNTWLDGFLFGEYRGVNVPFALEPISVFDGEGTYVFVENAGGVFDLTDPLLEKIVKTDILGGRRNPRYYDWRNLNWVLSSSLSVRDSNAGEILIDANMNHLQVAVPFMKTGSPDPEQYKPLHRDFPASPPNVGRFERRVWRVSLADLKIKSETMYPVTFEDPATEVKPLKLEWRDDDFYAEYAIPKMPEVEIAEDVGKFRPLLVVKAGGKTMTVPSTSIDPAAGGVWKFLIPKARLGGAGNIEPIGIELIARQVNLAVTTEPQVKLFLPVRQSLARLATVTRPAPKLLSVLAWDGQWRDLSGSTGAPEGSYLRLVFETTAPLLSLNFLLHYTWKGEIVSDIRMGGPPSPEFTTGHFENNLSKWVYVEAAHFKQTRVGKDVLVDIPVDAGLLRNYQIEQFPSIAEMDLPGYARGKDWFVAGRERLVFSTGNDRAIEAIEFTTADLQTDTKLFSPNLKFVRSDCEAALTGGPVTATRLP